MSKRKFLFKDGAFTHLFIATRPSLDACSPVRGNPVSPFLCGAGRAPLRGSREVASRPS